MAGDVHIADFGRFRISLRELRVFHAVATVGSVRRAAEALLRAPSAVTRSVAALEANVGVPLFERTGRGMLLTPAGERVRDGAERIAGWLADVQQLTAPASGAQAQRLAMGEALCHTSRLAAATLLAELHQMQEVARLLGVTQPAVSTALAKLQQALAHKLFQRTARGMRPTVFGQAAVVRFKRVLVELKDMETDLSALQGELRGMVFVGALPLARTQWLPAAIVALVARHPQLQVRTVESPYETLAAELRNGTLDLMVGGLRPEGDSELVNEVLGRLSPAVLVRAGHPLVQAAGRTPRARRRGLAWADLLACRWVLPRPSSPLRGWLREACAAQGLGVPLPTVETGDLALLRGLLLGSDMLALQYAALCRHELAAGTLVALPVPVPGPPIALGLTLRRGKQPSPGAAALIDELRRHAAAMGLPAGP